MQPTSAHLRAAFIADISQVWQVAREHNPDHVPYALVVDALTCGPARNLVPCVLTEQGLAQVARQYVNQGYHDELAEAADALRYSVADSPLFQLCFDLHRGGAVRSLLPDDDRKGDAGRGELWSALLTAATDALRFLDSEGLFGAGAERDGLLLLLFVDEDRAARLRRAADLNPPSVAARYERETHVDGAFASAETLALGTDGGLYLAGSAEDPNRSAGGRVESLRRVAAFDLSGLDLTRRWACEFPGRGDSIRQLALPQAGRPLHALRLRYNNGVPATILLLLDVQDGRTLQQVELRGEAASVAVRADGERVAVTTHDRQLVVLDDRLHPLRELQTAGRPRRMRYLRDGQLLVATDLGLQRLDPDGIELAAPIGTPAFRLSTDREERLLAASRLSSPRPFLGGPAGPEFGVSVYALPHLGEPRVHGLADHQAETAELSPDGDLLAFVAQSIHTARKALVVLDLATGVQLINTRCDAVSDLAFTADNRVLIVATSDIRTGPPVDLIPIPTRPTD